MVFVAYRFYAVRLEAMHARNQLLSNQLEQLHVQLDNTMHKQMMANKEVEQMKQMKQQMLSVISHEIRTPMNGIMGMSVLLKQTPLSREQQEYTETIANCGETLLSTVNEMLVNDMLDLSKRNTEEQPIESRDFDLRDCVEEVVEMFASKTSQTGVDLMYYIEDNVPHQIVGDSKRLQQVLMNLVENAVKFTSKGEIIVNVRSIIHGSDKPQLIFEVKDTGTGIPNDRMKLLFKGLPGSERGKQVDNGAGLGLVVCKKLIELMDGDIDVQSEYGKGSNSSFRIPLVPSVNSVRPHAREANMSKLNGKRVLIIDDNDKQRDILMKQMQAWNIFPVLAATSKQALEILSRDQAIDAVLIDATLADANAIEFSKSLQSHSWGVPIILMSVYGNESHKEAVSLFSAIISKPVRQNILLDRLLDIFSRVTGEQDAPQKQLNEEFSKYFPLKILIAEDNVVNQKLATRMLSKLGYQADLAKNGKEAIEMVTQEHYDIILMDVQMPEMDGLEATRMIRTCLEVQPVIIAVTANVMAGDRDACMQSGMDDYISKPIELNELLSQLEKWHHAIRNRKKMSA